MTTYYVSGTGNDKLNGTSLTTAFRTLQKAADKVLAGDTIYVMDGVYTSPYANILSIANKQGTPEAPITIAALPGHKPILQAGGKNWQAISITGSSYIVIEGLTAIGARDDITLEYALQQKDNMANPKTSCNGIFINYIAGVTPKRSHHITIRNNDVSKFPGGGIGATQGDYITIENNIVSGNGWYSPYGTQGIFTLNLWNSDSNTTDYKVIIRGNKSFDNRQLVPWKVAGKVTEGHGIILDTSYADNIAYTGKALIDNNIIYSNGGAGIQILKGENPVDITNNTIYQNSKVLSNGEIFFNYAKAKAKDIRVFGNIFYGTNRDIVVSNKSTGIFFENNIAYNGSFKVTGTGNILDKDPLFADAANGDFGLKEESPAFWNELKTEIKTVKQEDLLTNQQIVEMLSDPTIVLNEAGAIARITEVEKEVETIIKHQMGKI